MRAYKFLDGAGRAPFTGTPWRAGEWVEGVGLSPCRSGVHACRPPELAWWLETSLWEVELDGEIVETRRKIVARRGRLVRKVEGYGIAVRELAEVGARRAAELAVAALRRAGDDRLGDRFAAAPGLAELAALGGDVDDSSAAGRAAALAADAAYFALHGAPSQSPFVSACSAGHARAGEGGGQAAYDEGYVAERLFQSVWLADRLGLA